jgi:hypothetical protein
MTINCSYYGFLAIAKYVRKVPPITPGIKKILSSKRRKVKTGTE